MLRSRAVSACFKVVFFALVAPWGGETTKTEPCLGPGAVQNAPQVPAFSPRDQACCCRGEVMASCPSGCCLPAG